MAAQGNAPVVIKRKKIVAGGGHHGGAWKVAYADFVTAMMAFFMLMWLLGATTEKQRKGIADYFNPTIPVIRASAGGDGAFSGDSVYSENTLAQNGTGAGMERPTESRQARGSTGVDEDGEDGERGDPPLADVEQMLIGLTGESMISDLLRRHVVTRLSDEGLIIEIFATAERPLFAPEFGDSLQALVAGIAPAIGLVASDIAVSGHVRAVPVVLRENPSWDISGARAHMVRTLLEGSAVAPERIVRVTGHADRAHVAAVPTSARNDRVEIVLLRD